MSEDERHLMNLSRQLQKLLAKQPHKTSGRHEALSEWFKLLRSPTWTASDRQMPKNVAHLLLKAQVRA